MLGFKLSRLQDDRPMQPVKVSAFHEVQQSGGSARVGVLSWPHKFHNRGQATVGGAVQGLVWG